ncbi:GroES-like protein [Mycena floridula]|nr:GroES-like protein [Mycena floridula]
MAPSMMLAAVYKPGNDNMVIEKNHPVATPKHGEVLLKVAACGVCHSDVLFLGGAPLVKTSFVLGHEIAGFPVEIGEGVDHIKKHQLYSVLVSTPCSHGLNSGPVTLNGPGSGVDGGFAEYVTVRADQLVEVPAGVSPEIAAMAADAGVTAFNAVHNTAGIKQGTNFKVLIFGIGGLGHLAVQYAKHFGATVYACDIKPAARKLALELGATEAYDLIEMDQKIKAGFTVDITIDFWGSNQSERHCPFNFALGALFGNSASFPSSPKAVMASVGLSGETTNFSPLLAVAAGVQILSSSYGPRSAAVAALDLFAEGIVHPHVKTIALSEVNDAIDDLRAYRTLGRQVVLF